MRRPPVVALLASLLAHGGAVAILFILVSGESPPSVLFIDFEALSEREAPVTATEPRPAAAGGRARHASTRSTRAAPGETGRSAQAQPSTAAPARPTPAVPSAPQEPEPAREPEAAQAEPEEPRQPAAAIVPAREAAEDVAARSEAKEPSANPGAASAERTASTSEQGGRRGAPGTRAPGEAGGGGGTAIASGGPAGGAPGAEYGGYLAQMRRRLMEALRYPPPARNRGLSGTVLLDISIESSGAIGNVSVTRSSSHPLLDDAALAAARSLAPQPFPRGLAPRPLRVRLPVVFDLQ